MEREVIECELCGKPVPLLTRVEAAKMIETIVNAVPTVPPLATPDDGAAYLGQLIAYTRASLVALGDLAQTLAGAHPECAKRAQAAGEAHRQEMAS
jgi:hypothetical protein